MDIEQLRLLAEAERLMDSGEIPWVWAMSPYGQMERLSVSPEIMEILQLEQGQTVNSIIVNGIADLSLMILQKKIDEAREEMEESLLTKDFDFRNVMGDNDANDN